MDQHIRQLYAALEFDILLEKIASYASSALGRERILETEPIASREDLREKMTLTEEMLGLLKYDDPFPIHGINDVRESLGHATVEGSSLSIEQLFHLGRTLEVSHKIHGFLGGRREKYPALVSHFRDVVSFSEVTGQIFKVIDADTKDVKDSASSDLARLRKTIRREQDRVRRKLDEIIKKSKDYLQEPVVTLREGRLVIPLRDDCKGRVQGFVHDRSDSGATLFIEPTAVFEMNNRIREMQIEEKREIERLLRELTGSIRARIDEINSALAGLSELDGLYAIGRFSVEWNAIVPGLSAKKLTIVRGYHPLLLMKHGNAENIVPLDVSLDDETHLLVITGPNAGGKTVALKNVGLSALMFKCGFPVIADEQSEFPMLDEIFVDIGDAQSIEQDLSTFSAHVSRLAEFLEGATPESLVLIDEIGTGTDPAEGAALSMAFLERIAEMGAMTIATTHQGALKAFAHKLAGAENGSMAFDEESLQPTYKFRMGIPGSSYAFDIATRLGLPGKIIQRARNLVGKAHGSLDKFVLELEKKLNHYQQLSSETGLKKTELDALTKLYRERYESLKKDERNLKRKALEESKAILARANAIIEETVKEIRSKRAEKDAVKQVRSQVQDIKQQVEQELSKLREPEEKMTELPAKGDHAEWQEMKITGLVLSDVDSQGLVWFEAGEMKLRLPQKLLRRIQKKEEKRVDRLYGAAIDLPQDFRAEIDLRGMTMDEAGPLLDKYLDQAYMAGLEQARIIHGKGTGALRQKVSAYLKSHPRVTEFHHGAWNEGDVGVTIVHFEKG